MTAEITIQVLGGLTIMDGNGELLELASRKAEAIVVYLLFSEKASCEREELATLLWEDMPETSALSNLRVTLANIKKQCGKLLLISRRRVAINPEMKVNSDGLTLERTIRELTMDVSEKKVLPLEKAQLIWEELPLYRGDFLQGFFIRNAIVFEDWASYKRESLRREVIEASQLLIHSFKKNRMLKDGIFVCNHLLFLDPYNDLAYYALIELYALNGQRDKSLEIFNNYKKLFCDDLGVEPSEEITALVETIQNGNLSYEASVQAGSEMLILPVPNNIPVDISPFFGRKAELAQLQGYLHNPHLRLITIVGQGGTGKTRLALETARQNLRAFPDGVWIVQLESVVSKDLVLPEIYKVLGISYPHQDQALTQLIEFLNGHHILLILDNWEHLLDASPAISEILSYTKNSKILVTSREMTGLSEETNIFLEGLEGTVEKAGAFDGELNHSPASEMFIERAKRLNPDFLPGENERVLIEEICVLLARIPLGIELATSVLKKLSLQDLRDSIKRDISILVSDQPALPERQRSLMSVFNSFWEQLMEDEKMHICRLSTFCGIVTQDAAKNVAGVSVFFLTNLVSRGFLKRVSPYGYRAHSMHRQYVRTKFKEIPKEFLSASEKHSDYYLTLLQRITRSLRDSPQKMILDEMEQETCNFRAALSFMIQQGYKQKALAFCELLMPFWKIRGYYQEGYHWMDQVFSLPGSANPVMESSALCAAAKLVSMLGDNDTAEKYSRKSLDIAKELGDQRGIARALNSIGATLEAKGNSKKAENIYGESLRIYRDLRVQQAIAGTLVNLANIEVGNGHTEIAAEMLDEAMESFRLLDDSVGIIHVLLVLARISLIKENGIQAESQLMKALDLAWNLSAKEELIRIYLLLTRACAINKKWVPLISIAARIEQATRRNNLPLTLSEQQILNELIDAAKNVLNKKTFAKVWLDGENAAEKKFTPDGLVS